MISNHASETCFQAVDCQARRLSGDLCRQMEKAFAADFSTVRIYESEVATAIGARAFTYGDEIYFAPGSFDPDSTECISDLAHELMHVLQQREGRVQNPFDSPYILVDERLEAEAIEAARQVIAGVAVDLGRRPRSRKQVEPSRVIQCIKVSIDTEAGRIGPYALLSQLDTQVSRAITAWAKKPNEDQRIYEMTEPKHWLYMAGRLAVTGKNRGRDACLVPCTLKVGRVGKDVKVGGELPKGKSSKDPYPYRVWSERAFFAGYKKGDLNYKQISDEFSGFGVDTHYLVARDLLFLMGGRDMVRAYSRKQQDFLAGMVALMFGAYSGETDQ